MRTTNHINYGGMSESTLAYIASLEAILNTSGAESVRLLAELWPDADSRLCEPKPDCPVCHSCGLRYFNRAKVLQDMGQVDLPTEQQVVVGEFDDYMTCNCTLVVAKRLAA